MSECFGQILQLIFFKYWTQSSVLTTMQYSCQGRTPLEARSMEKKYIFFKCLIEISYPMNQFNQMLHTSSLSIVDNNVIFMYCHGCASSVIGFKTKTFFYVLKVIIYLTIQFCSNVAPKFIVGDKLIIMYSEARNLIRGKVQRHKKIFYVCD